MLLSTERLEVPVSWDVYLDAYHALNTDPEVMEHLSGPMTREASDGFARYGEAWYEREGLGLLPVVRRSDGAFLGMCGLHRHRWYPDDVEVGWRFARHAWGAGYATEAATAWLHRGFADLGLPRAISITTPANLRSQAVMRRLGMHVDHTATHAMLDGTPIDVVVHAVGAQEWLAAHA